MTDDRLIERLKGLCMRFDADPLLGRYEVAKRSTLNEQYLYQVLTGKPMANGNKRSLGKIARGKITKAFPDWLDQGAGDGPLNPLEAQLVAMYRKLPARPPAAPGCPALATRSTTSPRSALVAPTIAATCNG